MEGHGVREGDDKALLDRGCRVVVKGIPALNEMHTGSHHTGAHGDPAQGLELAGHVLLTAESG